MLSHLLLMHKKGSGWVLGGGGGGGRMKMYSYPKGSGTVMLGESFARRLLQKWRIVVKFYSYFIE